MTDTTELIQVDLLGDEDWLHVEQVCSLCQLELPIVVELVELGLVAPAPRGYEPAEWQLPATALPRLRAAGRLIHDLGVNASGAALVVELLDTQRELQRRVRELERSLGW